jgi:hypothetical protein
MVAVLDHLPHPGHARGSQQLAKLAQVIRLVIGERRDEVGTLTRATSSSLSVG